jgi:hypothetical protein
MKAWDELYDNPHISLAHTSESEYYIGNGVKIEKFNDGKIEIKNIMMNSETYYPVSNKEFEVFENDGWELGELTVQFSSYTFKLERCIKRLHDLRNSIEDRSIAKSKKERYELKIIEITERLNKLNN